MKNLDIPKNDLQSKMLWSSVLGVAGFVLCFSLIELWFFTFSRLLILAVSVFISMIVCRYRPKLPGTNITFSPRDILAFWGIIWLGVPGGVLLGLASSIVSHGFKPKDRKWWLAGVSSEVVSTFFAAVAFYLAMDFFKDSPHAVVASTFTVPLEVIMASCVMAITHYSQDSALFFLFHKVTGRATEHTTVHEILSLPAAAHTVSLTATVLLFLTFNHFGIEFGLVFVPLSIIGDLAYKIHVRRLEQKTKQIREANRMHVATVEALATAIDARDQVGAGHVRRTQIYAVGIANILGLNEDEVNAIRTGALLHDIGKLAIPDHILNKPGRLTPAEMEKTKTHSSVGASILEKVGFPYPVVPTVKYHHECWDGTGYPEGLSGNNIPVTARVLTVADAYDALRGARPYRPAVSRDDALNFLRAGSGSQFDPKIVDLFLRNLRIFDEEVEAQGLSYESEKTTIGQSASVLDDGASPNYVEQIKRANREVFTLYSLAREFSSASDLQETLSLFTDKIREFVPFDTCSVYLLDETKEYATAVHVGGKHSATLKGKRIKVGEGATGYVLKKCKPVENVDPALDFAFEDLAITGEYTAMASLPLIADDKLIGAVSLYSSGLPNYQDEHLRLLETVSRIAADAICKSLQHAAAETYALTDPMTGLPNSRSLQIQFDKEIKRAARTDNSFQVLVLDLDGFKAVNDTFGHKTGDTMLKEISGVISGQLREYDFLARYGGDEFVAVIPETHGEDVFELCRRIETAVNEFILPVGDDNFARVGVSIGSASYPNNGESFDQLIISADKAMYTTKAFHKKKRDDAQDDSLQQWNRESDELAGGAFEPLVNGFEMIVPVGDDGLIVELDETHIIASAAVN
jgi:diguanylate cyclase (GGDEF)-like protein/putative nucleotidyltransferase with HDIG domain